SQSPGAERIARRPSPSAPHRPGRKDDSAGPHRRGKRQKCQRSMGPFGPRTKDLLPVPFALRVGLRGENPQRQPPYPVLLPDGQTTPQLPYASVLLFCERSEPTDSLLGKT